MKRPDLYTNYENTQVIHYSELDETMGQAVVWDELESTELSGIPISVERRRDGKLTCIPCPILTFLPLEQHDAEKLSPS